MKLHRTTAKPDWFKVHKHSHNFWQRIAVSTKGIVTPGDIISIIGFALVVVGLREILAHKFLISIVILALGRLADVADGWIADRTGTKSPLGELLDAGLDKVGTILTVVVMYAKHLAPVWVLVILILPHVITPLLVLKARINDQQLHPSRLGKLAMVVAWLSLLGLILIQALSVSSFSPLHLLVYLLLAVSVCLEIFAMVGYATGRNTQ